MLQSKGATIWMVQADHLSGESLGDVMQRLYSLGAKNVQIVATITKKNRPGHLMFIDSVNEQAIESIEEFLVRELGISGHHRWQSRHFYARTENIGLNLRVSSAEKDLTKTVQVKAILQEGSAKYVRMEHDSAVAVQQDIAHEFGRVISLREISSIVESALIQNRHEATIELNGTGIQCYAMQEV